MQLLRRQLLLISICCYCSQLVESSSAHFNPYEVLNVPRSAPFDEIKRAYKRLALKYHPDRNANDPLTANNKFIQVNEAYQVLSNERSRSMYDTFNIIDSSSNQNNPFNKSPASDPHEPTPTPMPEETATVAHRFMNGMQRINNRIGVSFQRREILPIVSVLGTIIVMLFLGFILSYFDPANVEKRKRSRVVVFGQKPSQREYNGRLIHELKPQTFNGLVRCLKPGCRSIIILVNNATKDELIQRFGDIIYPYRKNKSLNFGYLNVDVATRLDWYRRLLQQTLVNLNRQLQLIPHKCIGTVLVLGGMRRYYSIYHAMHKESQPRIRRRGTLQSGVTSSVSGNDDTTCSSYIEFESDTDADEFDDEASCERASACDAESAVRENNADVDEARDPPSYDELVKQNIINPVSPEYLLAGLDLWLERLFDMKLQKYYISVWPNLR